MPKEFKYKHRFEGSNVKIFNPSEEDRYVAKASYQNLQAFLPKDVDFNKSLDLLGVSFSSFVANRANKNGQTISGEDAKKILPTFLRRPIDKDHKRTDIIGVITNYGFSEFGTERPLSEAEVDELILKQEPFNANMGGVLWRICDPEYIENLVAINSSDSNVRPYATSWEVGFSNFKIAEGSKNLSEARIIDDPTEIDSLYGHLLHFNGSGINPNNNLPIYLLICSGDEDDSLQGLAMGITKSPAAPVGPLLTSDNVQTNPDGVIEESIAQIKENILKEELSELELAASLENKLEEIEKNNESLENNSSTLNNDSVNASTLNISTSTENKRKIIHMKLTDITNEALTKGEITASALTDFLSVELDKAGKDWAAKTKDKEDALANEIAAKDALANDLAALRDEAAKLRADLEKVNGEVAAREKAENFNTRLAGLASEYDFDDEEKQIVAERIKELDQEGFDKYLKELSVLAKSKKKVFPPKDNDADDDDAKAAKKKMEDDEKEAKAKEALAALQANGGVIPPNGGGVVESQKDKWVKAFATGSVKVTK